MNISVSELFPLKIMNNLIKKWDITGNGILEHMEKHET